MSNSITPDLRLNAFVDGQAGTPQDGIVNLLGYDPSTVSIVSVGSVSNGTSSLTASREGVEFLLYLSESSEGGLVNVTLSNGETKTIEWVVQEEGGVLDSFRENYDPNSPARGNELTNVEFYDNSNFLFFTKEEIANVQGSIDGIGVELKAVRLQTSGESRFFDFGYDETSGYYYADISDFEFTGSGIRESITIDVELSSESGEFDTFTNTVRVLTVDGPAEGNDPRAIIKASDAGLNDFLLENGEGYYRLIGDTLVEVDPSTLTSEADLAGVYYCAPQSTTLNAQFMDPALGDVAPNLGETTPPSADSYPEGTLFEQLCTCVDELPAFQDPVLFEGYDPLNNWKPQRRVEINPGGPAAEPLGDELVINDANGRLFGINNRASDSTFDEITGVAFVMGETGAFDDGTIAGKEYIGTLEFDLREGYRTTANFNGAQLAPIMGSVSADGTLDGAMVDTETGAVLALFEDVNVL